MIPLVLKAQAFYANRSLSATEADRYNLFAAWRKNYNFISSHSHILISIRLYPLNLVCILTPTVTCRSVIMFAEMDISTIMVCLFFGANFMLFVLFQVIKRASTEMTVSEEISDEKKKVTKQLSKPFVGTVECFTNVTTEFFRTSLIMMLTYVCEKHPFYPHSEKHYSRDLFVFVLIIFFAYAFITIKPVHDLSLLGREQTEEWKGWMQFIFLLYHYFHAEEVYNSVRCMITCYVWMTGFGNFSFFYMKQDFGWLRVVQMLWRLNFSVLLLMWTHGNTYILYYICPLHTFYFLMVYAAMYVFQDQNHSKWGIRIKLMVLGFLIYILWDINGGLFDIVFGWLGTSSVIGANSGSVWEWYFRTSLDHWSTFLGMIFALNYPIAEQYFKRGQGGPVIVAGVILGALTIWWFYYFYTLPKMEYNLSHSYFAIIPLLSYIFFRNITPFVRSGVSMSLHELGKTTLETYLLQHHIWLTSNAKTLLTIIPDSPWINFALATIMFFVLARELYRLTMSLRGMILPDDHKIALQNILGLSTIFFSLFAVAFVLKFTNPEFGAILMVSALIFIGAILIINRYAKSTAENNVYATYSSKALVAGCGLVVLGLIVQLLSPGIAPEVHRRLAVAKWPDTKSAVVPKYAPGVTPPLEACLDYLGRGKWDSLPCPAEMTKSNSMCHIDTWEWEKSGCPIKIQSSKVLQNVLRNQKVAFIGDSTVRNIFHAMNAIIDDTYAEDVSVEQKHHNQNFATVNSNATIDYFWAPYVKDVSSTLKSLQPGEYKIVVMGAAAFDALHKKDLSAYAAQLNSIAESKIIENLGAFSIWVQPTTVVDDRLSADKIQFMNETTLESYRAAYLTSSLKNDISYTLNSKSITSGQEVSAIDGIHYSNRVSQVLAQMVANAYLLKNPGAGKAKGSKGPMATGSMGSPFNGLLVLIFSAIMVFFMDSFLGTGVLSLHIFGLSLDWDAAYGPLLAKIFPKLPQSIDINSSAAAEAERPLIERNEPTTPPAAPVKRSFFW